MSSYVFTYSALFLLFSFYFHFQSLISFTFTFQILFDLVSHLLFYLVFLLLSLLSFLALFIPHNLLNQKWRIKTSSFILFFHFLLLIFSQAIIFFEGTYFKFFLITVLTFCYLHFIINRRAHNLFGTLRWVSFLAQFAVAGLELGQKWGLGLSRDIKLSAMVCWSVFNFQGFLCH